MKEKRKFDIRVIVSQITDTTYNFTLQLESVFNENDLPEYYKNQAEEVLTIDKEEDKRKYLEMVYNFLKNNLENS